MKKINILFIPLLLASLTSVAGSFSDEAKIVSVERIHQDHTIREPYQDCYIKEFYESNSVDNPLGGALLGGIIGKQLDDDDSNTGAVVGALLGASMAQNSQNSGNVVRKEVCETKYRRVQTRRLAHYLVTYEYDGQEFSYTTRHKPSSDTVRLRVRLIPQ